MGESNGIDSLLGGGAMPKAYFGDMLIEIALGEDVRRVARRRGP
jgi:hypothetical protein